MNLHLLCLIVAFVLCLLAGFNAPVGTRVNLLALGLAAFVLAFLVA